MCLQAIETDSASSLTQNISVQIMGDAGCFWMNSEFHDATLLLSSDRVLLEQHRVALQEIMNSNSSNPKKRKASPASNSKRSTRASSSASSSATAAAASPPAAETGRVLTLPVHRIVLSLGSAYFKTAISTLIGDSSAANRQDAGCPCHPIIVVHEQDLEAAQGVLQFLYTKTLDSTFSSAVELMNLLLVSWGLSLDDEA